MSEIKITLKTNVVELGRFQDGFGNARIREVKGFVDELDTPFKTFCDGTLGMTSPS
jgi:hypothetical protein